MNIAPAQAFGEIVTLFPSRIGYFDTDDLYEQAEEKLSTYSYGEGDVFLPLGDPVVCAIAAAVLALNNDHFTVLKWDKRNRSYIKSTINIGSTTR